MKITKLHLFSVPDVSADWSNLTCACIRYDWFITYKVMKVKPQAVSISYFSIFRNLTCIQSMCSTTLIARGFKCLNLLKVISQLIWVIWVAESQNSRCCRTPGGRLSTHAHHLGSRKLLCITSFINGYKC